MCDHSQSQSINTILGVDVGDENSAGGVAGAEHLRIQVNAQKMINFKMKTENCRIYSYIE